MATTIDERELKILLKTAVIEALDEHRALVREIVDEASAGDICDTRNRD